MMKLFKNRKSVKLLVGVVKNIRKVNGVDYSFEYEDGKYTVKQLPIRN